MIKYFYKLIYKYISIYIRPEDSLLEVDPVENFINENYQNKDILLTKNQDINYEELKSKNFDYILLNGNIHYERDIQDFLLNIKKICNTNSIFYSLKENINNKPSSPHIQ